MIFWFHFCYVFFWQFLVDILNLTLSNLVFKTYLHVLSFAPGLLLLKMSALNSIGSEIAIKKLLFLGRLITEPNMTPTVRNLFESRTESYFDTTITSFGVMCYVEY